VCTVDTTKSPSNEQAPVKIRGFSVNGTRLDLEECERFGWLEKLSGDFQAKGDALISAENIDAAAHARTDSAAANEG
jgi:hypothetical protein